MLETAVKMPFLFTYWYFIIMSDKDSETFDKIILILFTNSRKIVSDKNKNFRKYNLKD
jgi:hypothetical protein